MPTKKILLPGDPGFSATLDVLHDDVRAVFSHEDIDTHECWGSFASGKREIRITKTTEPRKRHTFLHEYFHAAIGVMHGKSTIKDMEDPEEACVRACELGMVHLSRIPSNKWAWDYLFGKPL